MLEVLVLILIWGVGGGGGVGGRGMERGHRGGGVGDEVSEKITAPGSVP